MTKLPVTLCGMSAAIRCVASALSITAVSHENSYPVLVSTDAPPGYLVMDWARWAGDTNFTNSLTADETKADQPGYLNYTATFLNPSGMLFVSEGSSVANFSWVDGTPDPVIVDSNGALFTNGYPRLNAGFSITTGVLAAQPYELRFYGDADQPTATLTATLSDGTTAADSTITAAVAQTIGGQYLIDFTPGNPGETLTVTITNSGNPGGVVSLQTAVLSSVPEMSTVRALLTGGLLLGAQLWYRSRRRFAKY